MNGVLVSVSEENSDGLEDEAVASRAPFYDQGRFEAPVERRVPAGRRISGARVMMEMVAAACKHWETFTEKNRRATTYVDCAKKVCLKQVIVAWLPINGRYYKSISHFEPLKLK